MSGESTTMTKQPAQRTTTRVCPLCRREHEPYRRARPGQPATGTRCCDAGEKPTPPRWVYPADPDRQARIGVRTRLTRYDRKRLRQEPVEAARIIAEDAATGVHVPGWLERAVRRALEAYIARRGAEKARDAEGVDA